MTWIIDLIFFASLIQGLQGLEKSYETEFSKKLTLSQKCDAPVLTLGYANQLWSMGRYLHTILFIFILELFWGFSTIDMFCNLCII